MEATTTQRTRAACTECGAPLAAQGRLWVGEIVHCESCHAQLEVYELEPLVLGPRVRVEEDEGDFEAWTPPGPGVTRAG